MLPNNSNNERYKVMINDIKIVLEIVSTNVTKLSKFTLYLLRYMFVSNSVNIKLKLYNRNDPSLKIGYGYLRFFFIWNGDKLICLFKGKTSTLLVCQIHTRSFIERVKAPDMGLNRYRYSYASRT